MNAAYRFYQVPDRRLFHSEHPPDLSPLPRSRYDNDLYPGSCQNVAANHDG